MKAVPLIQSIIAGKFIPEKPAQLANNLVLGNGYDMATPVTSFRKVFVKTILVDPLEGEGGTEEGLNVKYELASVNLAGGLNATTTSQFLMLGTIIPYISKIMKLRSQLAKISTLPKMRTAITKMADAAAQQEAVQPHIGSLTVL